MSAGRDTHGDEGALHRRPAVLAALAVAWAVLRRPDLWPTAAREVLILAGPRWWRRWPPVPRPDPDYLRFRLQTAYGDPRARLRGPEVVDYLQWCRRMHQLER